MRPIVTKSVWAQIVYFGARVSTISSPFSSFRVIAAAVALVGLIEGACALALRPGLVERADLGLLGRFHNMLVFGKLADFERSSPDIIQVGDSSGFHGVRPEIVMRYLGGLKYVNLSCCAGTGFGGYYAIADFMLRRNPSIKTLVLYFGWSNLPQAALIDGEHQPGKVGEAIQNSLTTPFTYLLPPTIALRQRLVEAIRTRRQSRQDSAFLDDMRHSMHRHYGWWAEHDRRLTGEKRVDYWRRTCGEDGIARRNDGAIFYGKDRQSYMRTELERFARLAADHGAKLVVFFHPFPCRGLEGTLLTARREDIRMVTSRYDNVIALPDGLLEPWPTAKFVSADHLHVGFDEEDSRRVGRLLAHALGVPAAEGPAIDDTNVTDEPALGNTKMPVVQWRSGGALLTSDDNEPKMAGARRLIESAGPGPHFIEGTLAGVAPDAITVLSLPARALGARGILVELGADQQYGGGYCDLPGETAQRVGEMLDVGLDVQPGGPARCWVAMAFKASTVAVRLSLLDERLEPTYIGDGRSGAAIGNIELREAAHFVRAESSPW